MAAENIQAEQQQQNQPESLEQGQAKQQQKQVIGKFNLSVKKF